MDREEADTRIVVHLQHALKQGAKMVLVQTVDTDVIVILAGLFNDLVVLQPLTEIWVAFGKRKKPETDPVQQSHSNSSGKRVGRWRDYLPRRMPYSNM